MAVVRDEEESPTIREIQLHANQTYGASIWRRASGWTNYSPSVCPGRWCKVMPWQKSIVLSSKVFQFKDRCSWRSRVSELASASSDTYIVLQVHASIGSRCHGPESGPQLLVMDPDLDIFPVQKLVQPTCVVEMKVADDDLLDICNPLSTWFLHSTSFTTLPPSSL